MCQHYSCSSRLEFYCAPWQLGCSVYRAPAIAVLVAATVLSPNLESQVRAGQHAPAHSGMTRPFFGVAQSHRSGFPMTARPLGQRNILIHPGFHHHHSFRIFFGNSCFGPFFDPFFCRQFFFAHRFPITQPVFIPYPVYSAPYYSAAEPTPTTVNERESDLAAEIERLRDEVKQLRAEEATREQARQPANPPEPVKESEPTVLVFRDGHRSEIHNYAIVGKTLWALTEERARKIPISDLDMEATKKVNADRGLELLLP